MPRSYATSVINGGGGTGKTLTLITPTPATGDASNRVFTFSNAPIYVVVDQQTYFNGTGYTLSGAVVTFDTDNVPQNGAKITGAYNA